MVKVDLNFIFDYSTPTLIILMLATTLTNLCCALANMSQSYRCVAMVIGDHQELCFFRGQVWSKYYYTTPKIYLILFLSKD